MNPPTKDAVRKDGGYGWVVVFAYFTSSIIIDALRYAFGLLYIEFLQEFNKGKGETAWIGSLVLCVYNILGPVIAVCINRFGVRVAATTGSIIATIGLIACSFARQIFTLYFTYGFMQGVGLGIMFLSGWVAVSRCFEKKRGLALGIAQCGCGVGAFAISPILKQLIDYYGWRGAMLILAGICLNGCVLSMLYLPIMRDVEETCGDTVDKIQVPNALETENGVLLMESIVPEQQSKVEKIKLEVRPNRSNKESNNKHEKVADMSKFRKLLCFKKALPTSKPRSFADMRKDQFKSHERIRNSLSDKGAKLISSRSVNSITFSPAVLGSDASLERVLFKRSQKLAYDVENSNLSQKFNIFYETSNANLEIEKKFSVRILEKLFPKRLVTDIKLIMMMISTAFYSMATFMPINLIADYGRFVGCADGQIGWFVSAMGIGGTLGRVVFGFIVDMQCVNRIGFLSTTLFLSAVSSFLCPFLTTFTTIMVFSFCYGILIGSIYVVPPIILMDLFGEHLIPEIMGVWMYVGGTVSIIGTPIGGWLFDGTGSYTYSFMFCGCLYLGATFFNLLVLCTSRITTKPRRDVNDLKEEH